MEKIKAKIFPCAQKMTEALEENRKATERLVAACRLRPFPELKEKHIVNPR